MLLTCYFFFSLTQVVIPLSQLKAVNPSTSKAKPAEKYIQVISVDNHEFWFMGFVHYDSAVKNLLGALGPRSLWCVWGQIIWPCHGESHSPIVIAKFIPKSVFQVRCHVKWHSWSGSWLCTIFKSHFVLNIITPHYGMHFLG